MRAWSEMFNAFLEAVRPARATLAVHRRRLLRPRRRQAALRRGPRLPRLARATPGAREDARSGASSATARTTRSTRCSSATASTAYPGSVPLLDHLRDLGTAARRGVVVGQRPGRARGRRARRPVRRRSSTARSPTSSGLPGKPAPDTFLHAADGARRDRRRRRWCSRTPCPACAPARPATSALVVGVDRGAGRRDPDRGRRRRSSSRTSPSWSRAGDRA